MSKVPLDISSAHREHPRVFEGNKYIYPVISRRSGGVSLGINLNIDKACNFDCPYCQVDRSRIPEDSGISIEKLMNELKEMLGCFDDRGVCTLDRFRNIAAENKVLKDIALSGDGEPTTYAGFAEICEKLCVLQKNSSLNFKLVLITNGSMLHKSGVTRGVDRLLKHNGNLWIKLDAGTEEYYQKVNVSRISHSTIINNIQKISTRHPVTIQTLFFKIEGRGPSQGEIEKYAGILGRLVKGGTRIDEVQLHSISRSPSQEICDPLEKTELETIAGNIRRLCDVNINLY